MRCRIKEISMKGINFVIMIENIWILSKFEKFFKILKGNEMNQQFDHNLEY